MPTYLLSGRFLLDASERTLLRDGRPVPLTPKAFDLLRVLVEHHGHLVTKDALMRELWPGTFVDEANLNRCVSVVRKALGNGIEGGKYIETIPKGGYRFVAQVIRADTREPAAILVADGLAAVSGSPDPPSSDKPRSRPAVVRWRRAWAGAAAVLAAGGLVYAMRGLHGRAPSTAVAGHIHRQVTFGGKEGSPALSRDGRRIAYVSSASDAQRITVQELPDGRSVTILTAPEAGNLRWSPDGSELLFFARDDGPGGLFVVSRFGGVPRKIVSGASVGSWSPDGRRIAVAQYLAGRILLVDAAGRVDGRIALTGVSRWIPDIDWSAATGRLLVVGNDVRGRYTIWAIGADGSDQREIVAADGEIPSAKWAPHGDAVYYFRRIEQTVSLFKVPVQRSRSSEPQAPALLTGLETDGSFAISSDGKRLVYARAPYYSNLYTVDASAGDGNGAVVATQLTHGTSLIERPRVSPDGQRILFNIGHEQLANLYTIPITGGEPRPLTFFHAFTVGGAWSPDGRSTAFASTEGGKPRVWIMSAEGGAPRPVSSGELSDSFDILWSPAAEILYQQAGNRNYYVLNVTTGREQPLIADASLGWIFSPVYSPGGAKLAFAWSRPKDYGLWVTDTSTSSRRLVYGASIPTPIGWSADGAWIYAVEGKRAAYRGLSTYLGETLTQVKVMKISDTGSVARVVPLPFEEVGGIALRPDGRGVICAVYSSRSDVWVVENFDTAPPAP